MTSRMALALIGALALAGCAAHRTSSRPEAATVSEPTHVYVIRHLQKAKGDDPPLTAEGAANARKLADMLADKGIVAIFATSTRRAMETARPLATRLGIKITPYDPGDPDWLASAVGAAAGPVLVVGHSNTVPDLVDRLGGPPQPEMSEKDYGTLFVIRADGQLLTLDVR